MPCRLLALAPIVKCVPLWCANNTEYITPCGGLKGTRALLTNHGLPKSCKCRAKHAYSVYRGCGCRMIVGILPRSASIQPLMWVKELGISR